MPIPHKPCYPAMKVSPPKTVTVLEGIQNVLKGTNADIKYAPGCMDAKCKDMSKFEEALELCTDNKLVVMVMGMDQSIESEGRDRGLTNCYGLSNGVLGLPGCQSITLQLSLKLSIREPREALQ